jgi:hypothetical protein
MDELLNQINSVRREVAEVRDAIEDRDKKIAELEGRFETSRISITERQDFVASRIQPGFGKTAMRIKPEEDIQVGPMFLDSYEKYAEGALTDLYGFIVVGKENPDDQVRFPSAQLTVDHQVSTDGGTNQTFFYGYRPPLFFPQTADNSVTSAGNTLTDTRQNFTINELAGGQVNIFNSSGVFQFSRQIASNTATVITIDGTWPSSVTGYYEIVMPVYLGAAQYPWRQAYLGGEDVSSGGTGVQRRAIRFGYGPTSGANVIGVYFGTGSPESVVTANIGSVYHRTDGASGTTLYIKESGTSNTGWTASGSGVAMDSEIFTSSGTFTVPAGVTKVKVRSVGGGAGGEYANGSPSVGVGGGSGAYIEEIIDLTGVSTVTVTIGAAGQGGVSSSATAATAGGDTTFGAYHTAGGGQVDTTGGTATGGDLNIPGGNGTYGAIATIAGTNRLVISGRGGSNPLGQGGNSAVANYGAQVDGNTGAGYGGGGSGGATPGGTADGSDGGAGKPGIVIVEW